MTMTYAPRCLMCGSSLVGKVPVLAEDTPFSAGDPIPVKERRHPCYYKTVAYVECDCGSRRPMTPHDWHNPPEWL